MKVNEVSFLKTSAPTDLTVPRGVSPTAVVLKREHASDVPGKLSKTDWA